MEAQRRSKRKPLSDCTNILPNARKKPQSSTPTKKPNSKTLIKPPIKPPKPSNLTPTKVSKDVVNLPTNSSKSYTSIGSNNSSDSVTVPSIHPSSAPLTPVSNAGGKNSDNSALSVDQSQRHDATTRIDKGKTITESPTISVTAPAHKAPEPEPHQVASSSSPYYRHDATQKKDKGKMVADIPFIPFFTHMSSRPLRISSPSSPPCTSRHEIQGVQSHNLHIQTIKDKGRTAVDASLISKQLETSSDTSGRSLPGKAAHSQNLYEETRKEKEKAFLDIPNTEESEPSTPHSSLATPAFSGGKNSDNSGLSVDQSERHDATARKEKGKTITESPTISVTVPAHKAPEPLQVGSSSSPYYRHDATQKKDKGKLVADIPFIPFFTHMASRPLRISSPSSPPHTSGHEIQGVQSHNLHVQTIKDKGRTAVDASLISKQLETSSDTSGRSLFGKAAHSENVHEETRKEEEKTFLDIPNTEESEPSTPHSSLATPASSGTLDGPLTVYNKRRIRHGRKHTTGKITLSSHSEQRTRKTGLELDDDRSNKKGSHTDPLPVHKKKRSHGKQNYPTHAMPQEEIEKLRAHYADIDAFELPEEVASESDLE